MAAREATSSFPHKREPGDVCGHRDRSRLKPLLLAPEVASHAVAGQAPPYVLTLAFDAFRGQIEDRFTQQDRRISRRARCPRR